MSDPSLIDYLAFAFAVAGLLAFGFAIVVLILKAGHTVREYFRDEPDPPYMGLRRLDRDKDTP